MKIFDTFVSKKMEKNKKKSQRDLLIRESLEIKKNDSTIRGCNDPQLTVKSYALDPLLKRLPKTTNGGTQRAISQ